MEYRAAILDGNCLGKPIFSSRQKSQKHLFELYGLDPALALFRQLRRFAAEAPPSLPLLALTCAFCRDPQLRAGFALIEALKPAEILTRTQMVAHLETTFPARFSPVMLESLATRLSVTWGATGHLKGTAKRARSLPVTTPAACTYALFAGYLIGPARGLPDRLCIRSAGRGRPGRGPVATRRGRTPRVAAPAPWRRGDRDRLRRPVAPQRGGVAEWRALTNCWRSNAATSRAPRAAISR